VSTKLTFILKSLSINDHDYGRCLDLSADMYNQLMTPNVMSYKIR